MIKYSVIQSISLLHVFWKVGSFLKLTWTIYAPLDGSHSHYLPLFHYLHACCNFGEMVPVLRKPILHGQEMASAAWALAIVLQRRPGVALDHGRES